MVFGLEQKKEKRKAYSDDYHPHVCVLRELTVQGEGVNFTLNLMQL